MFMFQINHIQLYLVQSNPIKNLVGGIVKHVLPPPPSRFVLQCLYLEKNISTLGLNLQNFVRGANIDAITCALATPFA